MLAWLIPLAARQFGHATCEEKNLQAISHGELSAEHNAKPALQLWQASCCSTMQFCHQCTVPLLRCACGRQGVLATRSWLVRLLYGVISVTRKPHSHCGCTSLLSAPHRKRERKTPPCTPQRDAISTAAPEVSSWRPYSGQWALIRPWRKPQATHFADKLGANDAGMEKITVLPLFFCDGYQTVTKQIMS